MKKVKPFFFSIVLALTVGGLSALATAGNMNIYDKINPPPLAPPGWLFPVVWTVLFLLMGVSAARVFTSKSHKKDDALFVYAVSLVLNFSWNIFFFNYFGGDGNFFGHLFANFDFFHVVILLNNCSCAAFFKRRDSAFKRINIISKFW